MGAFWHLFLPVEIGITMNKKEFQAIPQNETALPLPFAQDFFEVNREEWTDDNKYLGKREKISLTYMIADENIEQIKSFFKEAWKLIETENASIITKGLHDFITHCLTPLSITRASFEKMKEMLNDMEDNYFLWYESIPGMVVYHGWPDQLHSDSRSYGMGGFIFLHSYEKMNVIPGETVLFYNLKDKLRKELSPKYSIANYVYTLGF
jgi:hypothetical protein